MIGKKELQKKRLQEYEPMLEEDLLTFQEKMGNANMHIPDKEIKKLKKLMLKTAKKQLFEKPKGWRMESARHSLAAKGLKTGRKNKSTATTVKLTTDQRLKQNMPIEVYETPDKSWRWEIYKKYQKDDDKQYARAFCKVFSPITREQMSSGYELGDVYISEIKSAARKVK